MFNSGVEEFLKEGVDGYDVHVIECGKVQPKPNELSEVYFICKILKENMLQPFVSVLKVEGRLSFRIFRYFSDLENAKTFCRRVLTDGAKWEKYEHLK